MEEWRDGGMEGWRDGVALLGEEQGGGGGGAIGVEKVEIGV